MHFVRLPHPDSARHSGATPSSRQPLRCVSLLFSAANRGLPHLAPTLPPTQNAGRDFPHHLTNQDNSPPASLTNSLLIAEKLTLA
ncbi:MAG TPA: hypothetical protein VNS58_20165 [Puia sp.]|nr:hypothetical protein [Puia sp.]